MKHLRITLAALALMFGLAIIEKNYAATFTVTNTNDSGAGSLREALLTAGTNNEEDTINFDPAVFSTPQTITLTSGALIFAPDNSSGSPKILTVNGPGANLLSVSGNNQSIVLGITWLSRAVINGLKITGGFGVAINVEGGYLGNDAQNLILTNSIVSENNYEFEFGGPAGLRISGTVTIINSAIINNKGGFYGGAINQGNSSVLTIINSTVSKNTTTGIGGALYNTAGTTYLINSTVAFNRSTGFADGGGGIHLTSPSNMSVLLHPRNSIIAKNTSSTGVPSNISGNVFSYGYNIIGDATVSGPPDPTNQINVDPLLDPSLSSNGGIIPTHALSASSPALDRGTNCVLTTTASGGCANIPVTTDARGVLRPQDADGNGTAAVDIGAFEATRNEILTAPSAAPDLEAASDSGVSNTDNITANSNLTFNIGGVTSGALVQLLRDGEVVSGITASGSSVTLSDSNVTNNGTRFYAVRHVINGVTSLQGPSLTVVIDNLAPTVSVNQAAGQFDPTTAQPINFTAAFNETVLGFDSTDVSLAGSTAGVSTANINISGSGPVYNIALTGISPDGIVTASIPAGAAQDLAGNVSSVSTATDNSVTLDNTLPTVTINQAAAQADPVRNPPVNFTVTFSEPVTGFNNADILLTGSTASTGSATISVTGTGSTYNVAVGNIFSNGGFVQVSIRPQAASDAAGNLSLASTSTDNRVTLDNTSPTVTINQAAGQTDPTAGFPINFTVVFSEPVTGFTASDITFSGSNINTAQAVVSITGSGANYNVAVGGNLVSNGGTLRVGVLGNAAQDALGNSSFASTSTDNAVTLDNVSPTVTVNQAIGQTDPASAQPVNFTVIFNELVTGLTAADISLTGSTANVSSAVINVSGSGNVYTVSVSGITSSGQVKVGIGAGAATDALGNPNLASTSTDNSVTVRVPNRSLLFDFDGDRKTDISIFRPSAGEWWYRNSSSGQTTAFQFGLGTDKIVPGDFTGDGKTDVAVFRSSTGEWFILRSEDSSFYSIPFGAAGDIPAVGDFDGDAKGDLAVFRPSEAIWYIQLSSGGLIIQSFGVEGDVPVVGDYDGDGKSDIAIFRPSDSSWWYQRSSDNQFRVFSFGASADKPVPGDYTGDGKTDVAVFRPATGEWFVQRSEDNSFYSVPFGASGDIPAPGDYDGDGKTDTAVFRPSDSTWYIQASTAGTLITNFGSAGDLPVPAAFVP